MENPSGQVLVIFGASGDLAKRKLLPALFALHCGGFLPENFAIIGAGRTAMDSEEYRRSRADDIKSTRALPPPTSGSSARSWSSSTM